MRTKGWNLRFDDYVDYINKLLKPIINNEFKLDKRNERRYL